MTTICTDGITIAADGLLTYGNTVASQDFQKLRVLGGAIYGFCGTAPMMNAVCEWHSRAQAIGAEPAADDAPKVSGDFSWGILVVDAPAGDLRQPPRLRYYHSSTCHALPVHSPPFAIGSGGDFAWALLAAGHSPRDAVATIVAKKLDVWTGGTVHVLNIRSALAPDSILVDLASGVM